jgi:hypothetical protein
MSLVVGGGLCLVRVCPVGAVVVGWGGVERVVGMGGSWCVGGVGWWVGGVEGPWGFVFPEGFWRGPCWGFLFVSVCVGNLPGGLGFLCVMSWRGGLGASDFVSVERFGGPLLWRGSWENGGGGLLHCRGRCGG